MLAFSIQSDPTGQMMTHESTHAQLEALTEHQVEALIGIKRKTLQGWRLRGIGPRWVRCGGRLVRYPVSSLHEWLSSQPAGGGGTEANRQ